MRQHIFPCWVLPGNDAGACLPQAGLEMHTMHAFQLLMLCLLLSKFSEKGRLCASEACCMLECGAAWGEQDRAVACQLLIMGCRI